MYLASALTTALVAIPAVSAQLNTVAKAAGKLYFGSATDNGELTDAAYVAILSNTSQFGQITPGNTMKWEYTEPEQNVFSYTQGDVIADFAEKNGQLIRCHNLVWYNQLPSWISTVQWTAATLTAAIQAHIASEVGHYKGQCYCWDVVNEALNDDGTFRTDVFFTVLGTEYINIAFAAAAAADPTVKLYYNDYNIESPGAKLTSAIGIVKQLQTAGIKIDGVGLQGHFIVGETPSESQLVSALDSFIALGVEVAYTEVDVRFLTLPPTTAGLTQQANDYGSTVSACVSVGPKCVGITVWDFDDTYSWIPSTFPGQGDADLWWANLTVKPAYASVISALGGKATPTLPVTTVPGTIPVTTPTATPPPSNGGTQVEWGQCGGEEWTGPTVCQSPFVCVFSNPFYSQCLAQ